MPQLLQPFEAWHHTSASADSTVVVPDGCRDLILHALPHQPPTWFVTDLADTTYTVPGMVGAMATHLQCLRRFVDDDGWIRTLMDEAENDVLAFMTFPRAHWTQIYSTNPLERLNAEIKRRTNVVGIFPNDASIVRLVGAMMLEQNDEWSLNRRYMQLEGLQTLSDTLPTRLSAVAR